MSKKEQGGIVLQKKHIVIGIIAAVVIIVTAVLAGMKLSRSQQQDTYTPDLEQGTTHGRAISCRTNPPTAARQSASRFPAIRLSACRPTSKPYRWRC